jgi:hypothetical protein
VAAERETLAERIDLAIALEAAIVLGVEPIPVGALELAREIEGHLRALLRDVICGHLALDLADLADELIGAGVEPLGMEPEPDEEPPVRGSGSSPHDRGGRRARDAVRSELFP